MFFTYRTHIETQNIKTTITSRIKLQCMYGWTILKDDILNLKTI